MKKKSIIAILLTLVMCFSLASCGSTESPVTVNFYEGESQEFASPAELISTYQENEIVNEEKFIGAETLVEGNITDISTTKAYIYGVYTDVAEVRLDNDCILYFNGNSEKTLNLVKSVNVDDYVKVEGSIVAVDSMFLYLSAYEMEKVEF